jgi:hypothetical protein
MPAPVPRGRTIMAITARPHAANDLPTVPPVDVGLHGDYLVLE